MTRRTDQQIRGLAPGDIPEPEEGLIEETSQKQPDQAAKPKKAELALDTPRVIALKTARGEFKYKTRRVTLKDWEACFLGIIDQTMRVDGQFEKVFDRDTALVELADRVLVSAADLDYQAFKDTKLVPISHRLAIGSILQSISAQEGATPAADSLEIVVAGIWPIGGVSHVFENLIHRFRHPEIEHLKRFRFESSRVRVRGEGKDSVSMYPSRLAIAMKIYDDLIESVDGYMVNGVPLEGVENIKREMDGAHKAVAALQIFTRENEVEVL
jgi:hypothetical protein